MKTVYLEPNFPDLRILLLFVFLFLGPLCTAQEVSRVIVEGGISAPEGFDSEGIHIYNKTAGLGTISGEEGRFSLKVGQGDTLYFSAVQFEKLEVVVEETSITSGRMEVEILEGLNELPEIVLKPHDLTGDLAEDSENIETVPIFEFPRLPPRIGPPTGASTTRNTVTNEIGGGANHLELLVKAVKFLLPKRKKKTARKKLDKQERLAMGSKLRNIFGDAFFVEDLSLSAQEIANFLEYSVPVDFDAGLLEGKKRLDLIQYMVVKSGEYKKLEEKEQSGGLSKEKGAEY